MEIITGKFVRSKIKSRPRDAHKGMYGKDLIIAGSFGMAGAAIMCGKSCVKTGAGLVRYAVPEEIVLPLQISVPEATCIDRIHAALDDGYSAIAIGPGLGNHEQDAQIMQELLDNYTGVLIIDADGLNNIVRYGLKESVRESRSEVIITPHPGEAANLLGKDKIVNREAAVKRLALEYNAIAVLKGAESLVCSPNATDGEIYINKTGNPGMATGGSGDVLTGMITGLAGQDYDALTAVLTAVYLHGVAGDLAADEYGEISMSAVDILEMIPEAFNELYYEYEEEDED